MKKQQRILIVLILFQAVHTFAQTKFENFLLADPENALEISDSIVGPHNIAAGYGLVRDFNNGVHEDYSIWFKFTLDHDTTLTFDIVPLDSTQDYDFLLFKCISKETFDSIRTRKRMPERVCFSQNFSKSSSTGLSEFATSRIVGAGPGSAYVPSLKVKTGETYYLMVDYGEEYMHSYDKASAGFFIYFYNYWPRKKPIVLNNVLFETSKSVLLPSSFSELDKLVTMLKQNLMINIEVRGHTDNVGNSTANQLLSEQRAHAVVDYLISKGIDKNRLFFKGLGSLQPIASNKTEEGKRKNRRVEFAIIMK